MPAKRSKVRGPAETIKRASMRPTLQKPALTKPANRETSPDKLSPGLQRPGPPLRGDARRLRGPMMLGQIRAGGPKVEPGAGAGPAAPPDPPALSRFPEVQMPVPPPQGQLPGAPGGLGGMDRAALIGLLPPRMQQAVAANGRDPREAINTRMQNDPIFQQKMIGMQAGGPQPGAPGPQMPDAQVTGDQAGRMLPGATPPPQEADIGAPPMGVQTFPGGPVPGGMPQLPPGLDMQRLRGMLPSALQGNLPGQQGGFQGGGPQQIVHDPTSAFQSLQAPQQMRPGIGQANPQGLRY